MSAKYREELLVLVESFEFEMCGECGGDVNEHIFAPDILGLPHAYCVRTAPGLTARMFGG